MRDVTTISITTGSIVRVLLWITIFAGLFYVSDFLVALLVAVVLASAIELPVNYLQKKGVPRSVSVIGIFFLLISVIALVVLVFIPPLVDDAVRFIKTLPNIIDSVRIFGRDLGFKDLALQMQTLSHDISRGQILTILKNTLVGARGFFATTSVVIGTIFNLVITFVLAFYLALEEQGVEKVLKLITPKRHEEYVVNLWGRAQRKIGLWMQGQLLLSFLVALLVYIPSLILGLPYASLLGLLAFFGELVPMVGLTLATIPALIIAWTHGGFSLLWIVALIYFIIAQVESHILYPKVMNKMVGVPSVVVIIAIVIGAKLAGIWGVLLAVPFASIIMEIAEDLGKRKSNVEQRV